MTARTHLVCIIADCGKPHDAKGFYRSHYRAWKRYGDPTVRRQASPGDGWIQRGYKYVTVEGRNVRQHILIAERALGRPLPADAIVHHVDKNPLNNRPENLIICPSERYHKLLHTRLNARAACGNADWRKCPYCGRHDNPAAMRAEKSGRFVHPACSARARRDAMARRGTA